MLLDIVHVIGELEHAGEDQAAGTADETIEYELGCAKATIRGNINDALTLKREFPENGKPDAALSNSGRQPIMNCTGNSQE